MLRTSLAAVGEGVFQLAGRLAGGGELLRPFKLLWDHFFGKQPVNASANVMAQVHAAKSADVCCELPCYVVNVVGAAGGL